MIRERAGKSPTAIGLQQEKRAHRLPLQLVVIFSAATSGAGAGWSRTELCRRGRRTSLRGALRVKHSCRVFVLLLVLIPAVAFAQSAPQPESGKFRLHKFEQAIGEENYTISPEGSSLKLKTDFKFTDRGSEVPLAATLTTSDSYVPQSFTIKGKTSRFSNIDSDITISGGKATIRQGKDTGTTATPETFFTISGYAPVAVQMEMMRYWRVHGQPAQMPTLPLGAVKIQDRGAETMQINSHDLQVERYKLQGLIWGIETLWMDGANNLAALVSTDAEFDHFEAVRDEYEPALAKFVASAAQDEMAFLGEMSTSLPGRRAGTLAFVGAT